MVLVFFDAKGVIYTNYVPKGETVNAEYIKKALARFLKVSRRRGRSCHPRTGSCAGTTPRSILPTQSRNTWRGRGSRRFAVRPIRRTSPRWTSSSSRRAGRGSSGPSPRTNLPPPFCGGWSKAKSGFGSAATMLKNS
jgi:hypothetical protein